MCDVEVCKYNAKYQVETSSLVARDNDKALALVCTQHLPLTIQVTRECYSDDEELITVVTPILDFLV